MTATASSIAAQPDINAGVAGDAVWLTSPDTGATVTWAAARDASRKIACQLDTLGLEPGAPVAVAAQNSIWSTLCFAGITTGGYLATPLNLVAGARVLSYVLGHSGAGVVLCTDEQRDMIEEAIASVEQDVTIIRLDPDNGPDWPQGDNAATAPHTTPAAVTPGLLMYTSGTTGNPKGVVLTHANLMAGAPCARRPANLMSRLHCAHTMAVATAGAVTAAAVRSARTRWLGTSWRAGAASRRRGFVGRRKSPKCWSVAHL